jgi:hypothetical protein
MSVVVRRGGRKEGTLGRPKTSVYRKLFTLETVLGARVYVGPVLAETAAQHLHQCTTYSEIRLKTRIGVRITMRYA